MSAILAAERRRRMLVTALGADIAAAMRDSRTQEIMVNPDGALRLDRLGEGRVDTGVRIEPEQVERIIRLVASHARSEIHGDRPIISADTARVLSLAVVDRKNILVAGGTSSGKTTLANALLAEMAHLDERVILIEDTRELQCAAPDVVALRTRAGSVTMADLVRSTLRLRPDRIIVGEVRGKEALDMLKAWNTGHPGGIATVHANSAVSALYRFEQLVQETVVTVPRRLIAEAIDMIVFISGRGLARRVETIARVAGLDPAGNYAVLSLNPQANFEGD